MTCYEFLAKNLKNYQKCYFGGFSWQIFYIKQSSQKPFVNILWQLKESFLLALLIFFEKTVSSRNFTKSDKNYNNKELSLNGL